MTLFGFCFKTSSNVLRIWSVLVLSVPAVASRWMPIVNQDQEEWDTCAEELEDGSRVYSGSFVDGTHCLLLKCLSCVVRRS